MHQLTIHKLGPIADCRLTCAPFMTFTGYQAAGKSTIAKAIFFFRTIKNDIYSVIEKRAFYGSEGEKNAPTITTELSLLLQKKFVKTFGSLPAMDAAMNLDYQYSRQCDIRLSLGKEAQEPETRFLFIEFSPALTEFLLENQEALSGFGGEIPEEKKQAFREKLNSFFQDDYDTVYIPAGRSMLTILSQQLAYIFSTMDDGQKRTIDYCTQDYISRILRLKPEFSDGLAGLIAYYGQKSGISQDEMKSLLGLVEKVLRGRYRYVDGEERLYFDRDRYTKVNLASSGQQEAVWILNLLFYYCIRKKPVLFILEEPESHLFPESQKHITDLIALVCGLGHAVILTTHSPYVLGALNNLLYAGQTPEPLREQTERIIPAACWLQREAFQAWFVRNGGIEDCMDEEIGLIQNERIDEISQVINEEFDRMLDLRLDEEG